MLGTLHPHIKEATIVGGGFAGLLMAYGLVKKGFSIDLYEASNRLGGLIRTEETPFGMAEHAANTLPATPETLAFLRDIGIEFVQAAPDITKGLLWREGKASRFPLKIHEAIAALFKAATVPSDGEKKNLAEWTKLHLGQAALDYLVDPAAHGIYGTHPETLEAQTAFKILDIPNGKTLLAHLWPYRKKPRRLLIAPEKGMQEIIDRLEDFLINSGKVRFHFKTILSEHPHAPNTIFCVPAYALAPYFPHFQTELQKIAYSSLVTATAFVKKNTLPNDLPKTFGLLVPRKENSNILGIIFNSVVFPNRVYDKNYECLTIMLKTMRDDDAVKESITKGLHRFLGCTQPPHFCTITRWAKAIPVYNADLRAFGEKAEKELPPGTVVFGNYTGDVSLRGMIEKIYR